MAASEHGDVAARLRQHAHSLGLASAEWVLAVDVNKGVERWAPLSWVVSTLASERRAYAAAAPAHRTARGLTLGLAVSDFAQAV